MSPPLPPNAGPQLALGLSSAALVACVVYLGASGFEPGWLQDPLFLVLTATSVASQFASIRFGSDQFISGWDWCYLLAIAFLDAPSAVTIATCALVSEFMLHRYRVAALLVNLASVLVPIVAGRACLEVLGYGDTRGGAFIAAFAATTAVTLGLHLTVGAFLLSLLNQVGIGQMARNLRPMTVTLAFQAAFAVCIAALYARFGLEVMASAIVLIAGFAYMAHLVVQARERTRSYANLSWGILSGLIRTLDARDKRAARHCAAVARFSRDIASATGMGMRDQEIAHTAGLLHDIGRFALSDRVMDGSTELTDEDWRQIRRHPSIGAELLADVDFYGPVADIIAAHHERMDGRGYPTRMRGEDIPPIARIVAVAEVYDTLTAPDTYRTPMTSFEALNELRRVAGRQLDAMYVEALAGLLAGQDTAYRHAGDADFDLELDIERRANEAAAT